MYRYLYEIAKSDLKSKMVFISGPRQVGKTTLAKSLLEDKSGYLNWDIASDRSAILKRDLPLSKGIVFDEIHKYRSWRAFLKGFFDEFGSKRQVIVTGSTRLDFYRFGGDTLQGRYFFLRLHPLSVAELDINNQKDLLQLLTLGGFPEPYLSKDERTARRWSESYRSRLIEEEITKVEHLKDLSKLELLMLRLPSLVANPLSLNNLKEDIEVSHDSIVSWMNILERFYAIFRLSPFGLPKIKAVKKAQKHYHYDWTLVEDPGARFENFIGSHLLKWIDFQLDAEGYRYELRYYKDVEGRDVDFVLMKNNKPIHFIECKVAHETSHKSIEYLKKKMPNVKASIVCLNCSKPTVNAHGVETISALQFLRGLV